MSAITFVGSGFIHSHLLAHIPAGASCESFQVRRAWDDNAEFKRLIEAASESRYIIYLGYHRTSVVANIVLLYRLLRELRRVRWKGQFVFFNTQLALPSSAFAGPGALPPFLRWDTYSFTKRCQSAIVAAYAWTFGVTEVFLPIVIGRDSHWEKRLQFIAAHEKVSLPEAGRCRCAWLMIEEFSQWFFRVITAGELPLRKVFVYSNSGSFVDLIKDTNRTDQTSESLFETLAYRHRFSASRLRSMRTAFRHSPIAVLMTVTSQCMRNLKLFRRDASVSVSDEPVILEQFAPEGSEYQFFGQSLQIHCLAMPVICTATKKKLRSV